MNELYTVRNKSITDTAALATFVYKSPPDFHKLASPFGLRHKPYTATLASFAPESSQDFPALARPNAATQQGYKYQYNDYGGKSFEKAFDEHTARSAEFQDELGLNWIAMDMRHYDPAIARWVAQDPITHHSMSPYNAFDNNPIFWADPSGADSERENPLGDFLNELFENSNSGDSLVNNGDGSFTNQRSRETSNCEKCPLKGGKYDGKTIDEIETGQANIFIRLLGVNTITAKQKKSWEGYDAQLEELIGDVSQVKSYFRGAAVLAGFSPIGLTRKALSNALKSKKPLEEIRKLVSKIKGVSPRQVHLFMLGVVLHLEAQKLGITLNSLNAINNNNKFEQGSKNGVFIITNTHMVRELYGVRTYSIAEVYSADSGEHIGTIR